MFKKLWNIARQLGEKDYRAAMLIAMLIEIILLILMIGLEVMMVLQFASVD